MLTLDKNGVCVTREYNVAIDITREYNVAIDITLQFTAFPGYIYIEFLIRVLY